MRVAAIDVGSNSIRLLVADVAPSHPGGVLTIARAGEVCRLGRGLDRTGRVEEELANRAGSVCAEFVRRARAIGVAHIVVGATAALRRAANGLEVAQVIEHSTGLPVRILTGEVEAQLVYRSVVQGLGGGAVRSSCVVFDLGGGSTEVVSGVGERAGRWVSLPIGAVTLTERHLHTDPPRPDEVAALCDEVRGIIAQGCAGMPRETPLLAGVGGTITVLASLDRGLESYDTAMLEGWAIPVTRLDALVDHVVRSPHAVRLSSPVMGAGRADIVAAGALMVRLLVERFPSAALVCSTQGLRYGLVRVAADEAIAREADLVDPGA